MEPEIAGDWRGGCEKRRSALLTVFSVFHFAFEGSRV